MWAVQPKKKMFFKTQKSNKLNRKKFLRYNFMIHVSHLLHLAMAPTSRPTSREWLLVLPHFHLMNCHFALDSLGDVCYCWGWESKVKSISALIFFFISLVIVLLVCILIKKTQLIAVVKNWRRLPPFCYWWLKTDLLSRWVI